MKYRILWLRIIVLLVLSCYLVTGCVYHHKTPETQSDLESENIIVKDYLEREVNVPAHGERIGCLYAFTGHVAAMLGKGPQIVAVVEGLKRDTLLNQLCPSIKDASVPSASGTINIEELLKADPDIVFIQGETAKNKGETDKLDKVGIPYLAVDYRNIREQQYAIQFIGEAIGAKDKADEYNNYYNYVIDMVGSRVAQIPIEKRIRIYHSVNEAVRTDSIDTLPADWTQIAGAFNVSVHEPLKFMDNKYFANMEQILLWDPEVILVNEPGVTQYILSNPQWSPLKAVKEGKVYQMPNGISRWGHPGSLETPLAILWTAKTLYPDIFSDLDMVKETKEFYEKYFHYPITDELALKVLHGEGMRIGKKTE